MIIIGHRGSAGIEPENTIPGIEEAARQKVDAIEFDIRITKDSKLVVHHDANVYRITGKNQNIDNMTLREISLLSTHSGHPIPSFDEAMEACADTPVLIDCKGKDWAEALAKNLAKYKDRKISITAIDHREMYAFMQLRPDIDTYVSELTHVFDGIKKAELMGFTGVSINFWIINPLAYWQIRRKNLKLLLFTVDNPLIARFLYALYPQASLITNLPNKLIKMRKKLRKNARN